MKREKNDRSKEDARIVGIIHRTNAYHVPYITYALRKRHDEKFKLRRIRPTNLNESDSHGSCADIQRAAMNNNRKTADTALVVSAEATRDFGLLIVYQVAAGIGYVHVRTIEQRHVFPIAIAVVSAAT